MSGVLIPAPLTAAEFAGFGDVIDTSGDPDMIINQGMCKRYHDLARLDFADGRAGISLFDAKAREFPHVVDMVERHPKGSQAFIPLTQVAFLVIVAEDDAGTPVRLRAFVTRPGQSVNLYRGVWHGVLAPIRQPGRYVVVDRIGPGDNIEEFWFSTPYVVE